MCSRVLTGGEVLVCVHQLWFTLSMIVVVKTLLVRHTCSPMSLHKPYVSVHAPERLFVHTSVFLYTMCASLCLRSSLFHSTTGIIIISFVSEGYFLAKEGIGNLNVPYYLEYKRIALRGYVKV